MRQSLLSLVFATTLGVALLAGARPARADPGLGYLDAAYELPWHYAFRTDEVDGKRVNDTELLRTAPLSAFNGGIGLGYNGLNGQLDFRNSLGQTTLAATVGVRLKFSFIGFELWGRAGIGPALVLDTHAPNVSKLVSLGAITSDFEVGLDYFIVPWFAVGVKGILTPQYNWPTNFAVDTGLNIGVRFAI